MDTPDKSSSSATRVVQDVWEVHRDELGVPRSSVDDFWSTWSRHAEAGFCRAYSRAGGPTEAGSAAFLGRGLLRIRSRRLGGRAVGRSGAGRLYRVSHGDEVDVHCAQYFVNSSLAPVVLLRRRLKSVADILKGTRNRGFAQARWEALLRFWDAVWLRFWDAVCRHGSCGPICSLHPWDEWPLPICMVFISGSSILLIFS